MQELEDAKKESNQFKMVLERVTLGFLLIKSASRTLQNLKADAELRCKFPIDLTTAKNADKCTYVTI